MCDIRIRPDTGRPAIKTGLAPGVGSGIPVVGHGSGEADKHGAQAEPYQCRFRRLLFVMLEQVCR